MCADRGGVFVWPVSNVHVAQHLDASGPARSSQIGNKVPLELWNVGLFDM